MKLCKHSSYRVLDHILDPKWSTKEILIEINKISPETEHYLIKFKNPSGAKKYGWFYMSGKMIRRHKQQSNGRGSVYVVPLSKREVFEPIKNCEHEIK